MNEPTYAPASFEEAEVATATKTRSKPKSRQLPKYKVILHNDDVNAMDYVVTTIVELIHVNEQDAVQKMLEAHETGVSLLLVTHKERAELYSEQFSSKRLIVTIERE